MVSEAVPQELEAMPLTARQTALLTRVTAPVYFIRYVKHFLDSHDRHRWLGQNGQVYTPPQYPCRLCIPGVIWRAWLLARVKRRVWRLTEAAATTTWHMRGIFQGDVNCWRHCSRLCIQNVGERGFIIYLYVVILSCILISRHDHVLRFLSIYFYQKISPGPRLCDLFRNMVIFYGEELLAPRPTPKLDDHPLSVVRDCLFNVFAATLHIRRPFLHPQPEDVSFRGDRDPLMDRRQFAQGKSIQSWSQWPRGLRRGSTAARLLGLWVRIPPGAWMSVSCECCVLSGRGLCDGPITRPEESYRVWCV
jgi:hypothetical protein